MADQGSSSFQPHAAALAERQRALVALLRADPADAETQSQVARVYREAGNLSDLATLFGELLLSSPAPDDGLLGQLAAVCAELEAPDARQSLIEAFLARQKSDHALLLLERAVRSARDIPARILLSRELAELQVRLDQPERALRELLRSVSWASSDAGGARPLALGAAHRALELSDTHGAPQRLLAQALRAIVEHEPDEAIRVPAARRLAELSEAHPALGDKTALAAYRALGRAGDPQALDKLTELVGEGSDPALYAEVLEARAKGAADPLEKAQLLAKAGMVHLERLEHPTRALARFQQSQGLCPGESISRGGLQRLVSEGEHRLAAAAILEPLLRPEGPSPALFEVLATRAELAELPESRIAAISDALDIGDALDLDPARRLELSGSGLPLAAAQAPETIDSWLERMSALGRAAGQEQRYAELLGNAALGPSGDAGAAIARAAAEAFSRSGQPARALLLYERALASDPTSPELLEAVDRLARDQQEPLDERLARIDAALGGVGDGPRRLDLICEKARVLTEAGDPSAAIGLFQGILEEAPEHFGAHEGLVDAHLQLGEPGAAYEELERGASRFEGAQRMRARLKLARTLADQGELGEALRHYDELLGETELDNQTLETVERIADEIGDPEILCRALEQRAERSTDPEQKAALLEKLGEVQIERLGDERRGIESWRTSARLSERAPAAHDRARHLYERMVESAPDDREASERLVALYVQAGQWDRIPEAMGALIRSGDDGLEPRVDLLLSLEAEAVKAGAVEDFLSLVEEAIWQLGTDHPDEARRVLAAKARVLKGHVGSFDAAADAYRSLVESYGREEDITAFEQLIEDAPDDAQKRELWRWLFDWRASRADDPVPVLVEWGRVEEETFSDPEAAIGVYEQALAHDGERPDVLERLARLRGALGDDEGRVLALQSLARQESGSKKEALDLEVARLLVERLDRSSEALDVIEPYLGSTSPHPDALRLAIELLNDADLRADAAPLLDRAARGAPPDQASSLLRALVESAERDDAESDDALRAWYERLLELEGNQEEALALALRATKRYPADLGLWQTAATLADPLGQSDAVVEACRAALLETVLDPDEAEQLGRWAVDFHQEWGVDASTVTVLLERILRLCPAARWALDRIKLTLSAQRQYDKLFELYDEAIGGSADPAERAELLDEAAVMAKDLAGDPDRAIRYLEPLLELRPDDARIEAALERLYERQGCLHALADLLERRSASQGGPDLAGISARIAAIHLELGQAGDALAWTERVMSAGDRGEAPCRLLERLIALPADGGADEGRAVQLQAAELLEALHSEHGRIAEAVGVAEASLELVDDPAERARRLATIAARRLDDLDDPRGAFSAVASLVRLQPGEARHRNDLEALSLRLSAANEQVQVLLEAAEQSEAPLSIVLLDEAARVCTSRLDDRDRAVALYQRSLAEAWAHPDTVRQIAPSLIDLLQETRSDALIDSLVEHLDAGLADELTTQLVERAVQTWKGGEAAAAAAAEWATLRRADQLCRAGTPGAALEELEQSAALPFEPPAHRRLQRAMATLLTDELGDPEAAASIYRDLLADDAADEIAERSLEPFARVLEALELDRERAGVLELHAATCKRHGDEAAAAEGWERAAALWEHCGDTERAIAAHDQAAALGSAASLEALARLHGARGEPRQAAAALAALCKQVGPERLPGYRLALAGALVDAGDSDAARVELERLGQSGLHTPETRARLAELYRSQLAWSPLAELLAAEAALESDEARRIELLREAASLHLERLEQPEEAIPLLVEALRLDPDDAEVAAELGLAFSATGQHEEAARTFQERIERYGKRRPRERAVLHRYRARALEAAGDAAAALEELLVAAEMSPAHPAILYELARAALEQGRVDVAEEKLKSLLLALRRPNETDEGGPARAEVYLDLADLATARGDTPAAQELVESAFDAALDSDDEADALQRALGRRDQPELLARALGERIERATDPIAAVGPLSRLAALARETGDEALRARAESAADRIVEQLRRAAPGRDGRVLRDLAGTYRDLDALDTALPLYKEAISLDPGDAHALEGLKELLSRQGRAEELVEILKTQLDVARQRSDRGDVVQLAVDLSELYRERGELDSAQAEIQRALESAPTDRRLNGELASVAMARGDFDTAIETYESLIASGEALTPTAIALSDACERAGRPEDARGGLERALEAEPGQGELIARLKHLYEAADAHRELASLLEQQAEAADPPERPDLWLQAAEHVSRVHGQEARTVALLERVCEAEPDRIDAATRLARAYLAFGRSADARALLERALGAQDRARTASVAGALTLLAEIDLGDDALLEAFDSLARSFDIDKSNGQTALLFGLVAIDVDRFKEAERALRTAVAQKSREGELAGPDRAVAYYHLARLAHLKGETPRARLMLNKALTEDPDNEQARGLLETLSPSQMRGSP